MNTEVRFEATSRPKWTEVQISTIAYQAEAFAAAFFTGEESKEELDSLLLGLYDLLHA